MRRLYLSVDFKWIDEKAQSTLPGSAAPIIVDGGARFYGKGGAEDSAWIGGYSGPKRDFDWDKVKQLAGQVASSGVNCYCLNIEHLPLDVRQNRPEDVDSTITLVNDFSSQFAEAAPAVELSFYSFAPLRDYWTPANLAKAAHAYRSETGFARILESARAYGEWQRANDVNARLLMNLHWCCPSVYRFYENQFSNYVSDNVREARRIAGDKPVLPFFWPRYHGSNKAVGLQTVPMPSWKGDFELALNVGIEGAIIWGWDEKAHAEYIAVAQSMLED